MKPLFDRTLTLVLAVSFAFSQASAQSPLIKQNFKDDAGGWTTIGGSGKISVTHQGPIAPVGLGALQFDYKVAKGEITALVLPIESGALSKAKSVKFEIMTDSSAPIAVMLQEKDGGRYVAFCNPKKNSWQPCVLSVSDFYLAQEPTDPKDPDGKLDLDQVNMVGIMDIEVFLASLGSEPMERLLHVQKGDHILYLDRFSIETDEVPSIAAKENKVVYIDRLNHPQLSWFAIGDLNLSLSAETPLTGNALRWEYRQDPEKFVGSNIQINPGMLTGTSQISFDVSSKNSGTMRVQLEELGGVKFSTSVDLPKNGKVKHVVLNFSDFRSTEDSSDPKAALDLGKVKTLFLMDATGVLGQNDPEHPDNVLCINHLQANP